MHTALVRGCDVSPPIPHISGGGSCISFHCGWTAVGAIMDTSAKVSGPTVMRVDECNSDPVNALNTLTRSAFESVTAGVEITNFVLEIDHAGHDAIVLWVGSRRVR